MGGGISQNQLSERLLYAFPHIITWLENDLNDIEQLVFDGTQSPIEQIDDLFNQYVTNQDLSYYEKSHSMRPDNLGVWELKTPDVRIFGWFNKKGVFIIAEIASAFHCKQHNLYAGYRGGVVRRRDDLMLDEPKYIIGDYRDVL